MTQQPNRNRRRGPVRGPAQPAAPGSDRYQKYLPEWMKSANGAPPPRPARPRRARQQRPAGGYTPGKLGMNGSHDL